jgi:hypothetical protein
VPEPPVLAPVVPDVELDPLVPGGFDAVVFAAGGAGHLGSEFPNAAVTPKAPVVAIEILVVARAV